MAEASWSSIAAAALSPVALQRHHRVCLQLRGQAPARPLLASAGRCPAGRALRLLGWLLLHSCLMEEEEGPHATIGEKGGG